jgi:hypothetical protein
MWRVFALDGADEKGTHERLRAHFRELVDPKIAEHRGRMFLTLPTRVLTGQHVIPADG